MIHDTHTNFCRSLIFTLALMFAMLLLVAASAATTRAQTTRRAAHAPTVTQPIYSEYRGIRLGMTAQEVRTKLGEPLLKADDGDVYSFSEKETAQIAYDAQHLVITISVDYLGGVGAPEYKAVVGADVEIKPDGQIYKMVRYDTVGLWVYYNRTGGDNPLVTITLQKSVQGR
jgi:hypothetical protein